MDFENMSDDELIVINRVALSSEKKDEHMRVLIRKVLWQDIIAKGMNYYMLAINVCRSQDGLRLRDARDRVDTYHYRNLPKDQS